MQTDGSFQFKILYLISFIVVLIGNPKSIIEERRSLPKLRAQFALDILQGQSSTQSAKRRNEAATRSTSSRASSSSVARANRVQSADRVQPTR